MNPETRERLAELLPKLKEAASSAPTPNGYNRLMWLHAGLRDFLNCDPSLLTADQWLVIAEEATKETA